MNLVNYYHEWLWEFLEPRVDKLMLADAVELKYRAGKRHAKTDKIDAKFISLLVFRNEVPVIAQYPVEAKSKYLINPV